MKPNWVFFTVLANFPAVGLIRDYYLLLMINDSGQDAPRRHSRRGRLRETVIEAAFSFYSRVRNVI